MKKIILLFLSFLMTISLSAHSSFVKEHALKDSLLGMLARFTQYVSTDYQDIDEKYGCFRERIRWEVMKEECVPMLI